MAGEAHLSRPAELELPVAQVERQVALGALHHAVEHGMPERPREIALRLRMAIDAQTRLVLLQKGRRACSSAPCGSRCSSRRYGRARSIPACSAGANWCGTPSRSARPTSTSASAGLNGPHRFGVLHVLLRRPVWHPVHQTRGFASSARISWTDPDEGRTRVVVAIQTLFADSGVVLGRAPVERDDGSDARTTAATAAAIKKIRLTRKANLSGNSFLGGRLSSWRRFYSGSRTVSQSLNGGWTAETA